MKYETLITKGISLALTAACLAGYQIAAVHRADETRANQAEIARVEAHNAEILARHSGSESESLPVWEDGVFEGRGVGFGGEIAAAVTVENGRITAVDILSASGEDPAYFAEAEAVADRILAEQSAEVDTVSGATFSSGGILEAVRNALEQGKVRQ